MKRTKKPASKTRKVTVRRMALVQATEEAMANAGEQRSGIRVGTLKIVLPTVETAPVPDPIADVAEEFARHLVNGDFNSARAILMPSLRRIYTVRKLKRDLVSMHSYAPGPITHFEVTTTLGN